MTDSLKRIKGHGKKKIRRDDTGFLFVLKARQGAQSFLVVTPDATQSRGKKTSQIVYFILFGSLIKDLILGDRPAAGLRTLTPSTQVRILVSQPIKLRGYAFSKIPFFISVPILCPVG